MSFEDPFDGLPDDNVKDEAQTSPAADVIDLGVSPDGVEYSLTFKGTGGHADRWLVVRFPTAKVGNQILNDPEFKEVLDGSRRAAEYDFRAYQEVQGRRVVRVDQPPAQAPQGNAPAAAQQAPGGEKRFCKHGEMVFKSGVSKAGNAYKLFSCTAPRDQQCKAEYLK